MYVPPIYIGVTTEVPALTTQLSQCPSAVRALLVLTSDCGEQAAPANATEKRREGMALLAVRLATALETPTTARGPSHPKPIEIKTPEEFSGPLMDLERFKNQLSLVLADEARFPDERHKLRYCFFLLKGDAYATMELALPWTYGHRPGEYGRPPSSRKLPA